MARLHLQPAHIVLEREDMLNIYLFCCAQNEKQYVVTLVKPQTLQVCLKLLKFVEFLVSRCVPPHICTASQTRHNNNKTMYLNLSSRALKIWLQFIKSVL